MIKEFNVVSYEADYAGFMIGKSISKKEREEWEEEESYNEDACVYLADKIKELNPSKYMLKKYAELEDILEYSI